MTKKAEINKTRLETNDYIAFEYAAADVDDLDYTVWMRITEVIFENGETFYKVVFPNGEEKRGLVPAIAVGRFRKALDYMMDEYDYELANEIYNKLSAATIGHEFTCECDFCNRLYSMVGALRAYEESITNARFYERKQRLQRAA
jgi:hypothetical protein